MLKLARMEEYVWFKDINQNAIVLLDFQDSFAKLILMNVPVVLVIMVVPA